MKTSHSQFSEYASMDTTNVLRSYYMIVDMHRFALMWLVYSRNKFFRVGPNISEEFVPGGTNFRGVQIKHDKHVGKTLLTTRSISCMVPLIGFCFTVMLYTGIHVQALTALQTLMS